MGSNPDQELPKQNKHHSWWWNSWWIYPILTPEKQQTKTPGCWIFPCHTQLFRILTVGLVIPRSSSLRWTLIFPNGILRLPQGSTPETLGHPGTRKRTPKISEALPKVTEFPLQNLPPPPSGHSRAKWGPPHLSTAREFWTQWIRAGTDSRFVFGS